MSPAATYALRACAAGLFGSVGKQNAKERVATSRRERLDGGERKEQKREEDKKAVQAVQAAASLTAIGTFWRTAWASRTVQLDA